MNYIFNLNYITYEHFLCLLIYACNMDIVSSVDKVIKNIKFKHV